ncbi:MAG TPA: methyltransferase domain-containing protein [Polyangia bacterium]|nr:methyltransferase domain-containing protein [Polyangia bacterium]
MTASSPPVPEEQARLAKLYDAEILPAYAARFARLLVARLQPRPRARVVEIGCATGGLTRELARLFPDDSHLTAVDESPAFLAEARGKIEALPRSHPVVTFVAHPGIPLELPIESGAADDVVSNLAVAGCTDPPAAVREATRLLVPGGRLVLTAPLRGTWTEFLDLFRDVLADSGKPAAVTAVDRYTRALPDGDVIAGWLRAAGLVDVAVTVDRWEVLFRTAREFFFAPLVADGPLPLWKRLAGPGDDMQDVFFFTKEAIDTYFKGRPFAVTVVAAAVAGHRPERK